MLCHVVIFRSGQYFLWDITWLPSVERGRWCYLSMITDLCSRKITGDEMHETESVENAAALMQRSVIREDCWRHPLVLHADNGAAMG
ncbi:DDE-type integrase/transposase/recombinase [Tatumella sp. JGM118]|uniref:DDE-type integrase/transposase/recombinase n=1 Tax=Tatumella terrea TaxID=419007 RepID=A0ABW1VVV6_9GAMM